MITDYYAVLGVPPAAKAREIKAAYYKLSIENHPDTHPGDTVREEMFKCITMAKAVLFDEKRRAAYDAERRMLTATCFKCGGSGVIKKQKGFSQRVAVPCSACGATGKAKR
jgi:molecular chaperone DnaJ